MRVIKKVNKWTPEMEATLREMVLAGKHYSETAAVLGVTHSAVEQRRTKLGLPPRSVVLEQLGND